MLKCWTFLFKQVWAFLFKSISVAVDLWLHFSVKRLPHLGPPRKWWTKNSVNSEVSSLVIFTLKKGDLTHTILWFIFSVTSCVFQMLCSSCASTFWIWHKYIVWRCSLSGHYLFSSSWGPLYTAEMQHGNAMAMWYNTHLMAVTHAFLASRFVTSSRSFGWIWGMFSIYLGRTIAPVQWFFNFWLICHFTTAWNVATN